MWNYQAILDSSAQSYFSGIKKRDRHLKKTKIFLLAPERKRLQKI